MSTLGDAGAHRGSRLDRALRIFADVRPGEGTTTLLLAANLFLILTAYYVLKPVREALILGQGSPELKAYLSAAQVAVLAVVVPVYGRLVSQLARRRLINVVNLIFIGCLLTFYVVGRAGVPIGIAFFIWIGVFNLMIVAQFWSFANDLYTRDEGERLFPVIGFGAALGGVLGAYVAARLIRPLGVHDLLLVGAGLLAAQVQITNYVDRRVIAKEAGASEKGAKDTPNVQSAPAATTVPPAHHENAFAMVLRTPYLRAMAIMMLLIATVDGTGEYILGTIVKDAAQQYVADGRSHGLDVSGVIGAFYSRYFFLINVTSVLLQFFLVSRIIKYAGVRGAVAILPVLSIAAYNMMAFAPSLWFVLGAKVTEKSANYSLNNTVQNMLYLPCTREEKYSAKQAIDAFFFRMGDVFSAVLVFTGTSIGLSAAGFAKANIALAALWLAMAWVVGQRYTWRQPTIDRGKQGGPVRRTIGRLAGAGAIVAMVGIAPAQAQLNTQHIKGTVGLKGASQPPPHWYLVAPVFYAYDTETVRDRNGDELPINEHITVGMGGFGFTHVTTKKVFGADYGYSALFAFINNRLQGTDIDLNPGGGFTDTAVVPIALGWHFKRADLLAQYSLFIPTGRYTDGATDNLGLGMWGHEPAFGTTVYLTADKKYHASTVASFNFQSKKEDSETKVGNAMNLEGGIGADFLKGGVTAGLVYYTTIKLQQDIIDGIPGFITRGKNKVFALGPEVSIAIASKNTLYGFVKVNYQWEVAAYTNTQGSAFSVIASFPMKPIKLPGK